MIIDPVLNDHGNFSYGMEGGDLKTLRKWSDKSGEVMAGGIKELPAL